MSQQGPNRLDQFINKFNNHPIGWKISLVALILGGSFTLIKGGIEAYKAVTELNAPPKEESDLSPKSKDSSSSTENEQIADIPDAKSIIEGYINKMLIGENPNYLDTYTEDFEDGAIVYEFVADGFDVKKDIDYYLRDLLTNKTLFKKIRVISLETGSNGKISSIKVQNLKNE